MFALNLVPGLFKLSFWHKDFQENTWCWRKRLQKPHLSWISANKRNTQKGPNSNREPDSRKARSALSCLARKNKFTQQSQVSYVYTSTKIAISFRLLEKYLQRIQAWGKNLYFLCLEAILLKWILKYSGIAKCLASFLWQVQTTKCWNRCWYSNILNINVALIRVNTIEESKSWISKFKKKIMLKKKDNMYQYNHLFPLKLKRGEIIKGSSELRGTRNTVFIFWQREWRYCELSKLEQSKISLLLEQLGLSQVDKKVLRAFTFTI